MPFIRPFNIASNDQSRQFEHDIKATMYKGVYEAAEQKKVYIRFTGLGVGIASGLLTIAMRIASFCENLFKGFINIVGAPFDKGLSCSRGFSMLFFHAPKNLVLLPFSVFSAALKLFEKTAKVARDGSNYSYKKWCEHDPVEKVANDQRIERNNQAERQAAIARRTAEINQAQTTLATNPNDLNALLTLATAYETGAPNVNIDPVQAHNYRLRAAQQGHVKSMGIVGNNFLTGKGTPMNAYEAIAWHQRAADGDDLDGMAAVGVYYYMAAFSPNVTPESKRNDLALAAMWSEKAAARKNSYALYLLGRMYLKGEHFNKDIEKGVQLWKESAKLNYQPAIDHLAGLFIWKPELRTRYGNDLDLKTSKDFAEAVLAVRDI